MDVLEDVTAEVICGAADMGQVANTAMAQIAAHELCLPVEDVAIRSGDTMYTPEAGASSASRQTYVSGNTVRIAAAQAKATILTKAALLLNTDIANLTAAGGL